MNFRRIPFQFTTTDPTERQRELEKRFGIPANEMYVDSNPGFTENRMRESSSASSSPRLQHRVPIFVEGADKPLKPAVDSQSMPEGARKPHVRVIPIEVEGANSPHTTRQRTFSGPAGFVKNGLPQKDFGYPDAPSPTKRSMQDLSSPNKLKSPSGPRVCNIPIQIEGKPDVRKTKSPISSSKSPRSNSQKKKGEIANGCHISKTSDENKAQNEKSSEPNISIPLKKIENILEEFKMYKIGVENFNGTVKDKQYRYLDEMLTRCMLKLDDIDTLGNETVRLSRKAAVKQVQQCIDELESKVNPAEDSTKEGIANVDVQGDQNSTSNEKSTDNMQKDEEMVEAVDETSEKDEEMQEAASETSGKDEEMKEVIEKVSVKDEEIKETVAEMVQKDEKEVSDSLVPEVEMEENDNIVHKLVEADNEIQPANINIQSSGNAYDAEMEEVDMKSKESDLELKEYVSGSQAEYTSEDASCTDICMNVNQNIPNSEKPYSTEGSCNMESESNLQEVSNRGIVQTISAENIQVSCAGSNSLCASGTVQNKLENSALDVSQVPVAEVSERTGSFDCDMQNTKVLKCSCESVMSNQDKICEKKSETDTNSETEICSEL